MQFETDRLLIRPARPADAAQIFANYAQDPEVTRYMTWEPHRSLAQTAEWIDHCVRNAETDKGLIFVIHHKADDQAVGMFDFRLDGFMADFGYVLARKHWGRGLMTEALRPVFDLVFSWPRIYRIWAVHDVDNPASGRVMQKLGMTREGTLKRFSLHPNLSAEPRDACLYARCK